MLYSSAADDFLSRQFPGQGWHWVMKRLLQFYDWISMGRDVFADLGLVTHLMRSVPVAGFVAGYSIDYLAGGLIGGGVAIAGLALVFLAAVLVALRRMPVSLSVSLVRRTTEEEGEGALSTFVESTDGNHPEPVRSRLVATLTGNARADRSAIPISMTGLHAEMSKMVFGLVPVPVARLDLERFDGAYASGDVDWVLPSTGEVRSVLADFAADEADFSHPLAPGDRVRTRVVARFSGVKSNLYVQLPGEIVVRPTDRTDLFGQKTNEKSR